MDSRSAPAEAAWGFVTVTGTLTPDFTTVMVWEPTLPACPPPNQVRGADRAPGRGNAPVRAVAENDLRLIAVIDLHAEVRVVGVAVEQRPTLLPHLEPAAGIDLDAQVVLGVWVPRQEDRSLSQAETLTRLAGGGAKDFIDHRRGMQDCQFEGDLSTHAIARDL